MTRAPQLAGLGLVALVAIALGAWLLADAEVEPRVEPSQVGAAEPSPSRAGVARDQGAARAPRSSQIAPDATAKATAQQGEVDPEPPPPPGEQPLLRVCNAAGLPLEAVVSSLAGARLASGRGEVRVPALPGQPVRVASPGHLPEILPLAAGSTELVLSPGRVLAGEVVAAEDGRPLAGARVEAMAALTQSDAGGRFELAVPLEGRAELLVTAADRPATRAREGEGPLRIEVPRGLGARGRVVRSDGAAPGVVELLLVGGQQLHRSFRARSQPDGRFELAGGLLEGEQVMVFARAADGWQTPRAPRWQVEVDALSATLEAPAALTLAEPCALAPLHAWPGERPRLPAARRHGQLAPGRYRVEPAAGDPQVVELGPGEERELLLQPPPPARDGALVVRVIDEVGAPVPDAQVSAQLPDRVLSARADAGGVAELRLPSAALSEPLTVSGRAPERVAVPSVAAPGAREVELVLARRAALELVVSPAQALEVAVFRGEASLARARTDAQGRLRLADLPAGEVRVVIETPQGVEVERALSLPTGAPVQIPLERE